MNKIAALTGKLCAYIILALSYIFPAHVYGVTGLPWSSSFETGDFSEWNGYQGGQISLVNHDAIDGRWATRISLVENTLNNNYLEHYFGDHIYTRHEKVDELYLQFYSKFESGYQWQTRQSHKIAIINLTDGITSDRRYQVYIWVTPDGYYAVDHSDMDDWLFYGLFQNVGTRAPVRFDQWDKLKLYVRQNTPGVNNGIVKLWINDVIKVDYSGLNLRENTNFGMNKLILTSYSNPSGGVGYQWSDNWSLTENDPDADSRPMAPELIDVR